MLPNEENSLQCAPKTLPLTVREQEVLRELARGNSNKGIARVLYISTHTVDGYVKEIFRKLGVHNRSMAAVIAVHHGMLDKRVPSLPSRRISQQPESGVGFLMAKAS